MAEKAKAKKAKPLAKKTASVRPKKKEISVKDAYTEADAEELTLAQEALPKRPSKTAAPKTSAKKDAAQAPVAEKAKAEAHKPREEKAVKAHVATQEIVAPAIQPRVTPAKPQVQEHRAEKPRHEPKPSQPAGGLNIRLSESLVKKLKDQAADEGISLEEFVAELLAESVVLRAWEIVERKNAMKGHSGHGQPSGNRGGGNYNQNQGNNKSGNNNNNNHNQRGGNQGNKGHRGMTHARYQTIMDDKATFLEYVRNQEKTRR